MKRLFSCLIIITSSIFCQFTSSFENYHINYRDKLLHLNSLKYDVKKSKIDLRKYSLYNRFIPDVRVHARLSTSDFSYSMDSDEVYPVIGNSFSVSLSWNINEIFYSFKREKAQLSLLNSKNSYNSYINTIASDTSSISSRIKLLNNRISFLKKELKVKEKFFRLSKEDYNSGSISYQEFIRAKHDFIQAKKDLNSILLKKNKLTSKYDKYTEFLNSHGYLKTDRE